MMPIVHEYIVACFYMVATAGLMWLNVKGVMVQ